MLIEPQKNISSSLHYERNTIFHLESRTQVAEVVIAREIDTMPRLFEWFITISKAHFLMTPLVSN